jgi:hypothetical protein
LKNDAMTKVDHPDTQLTDKTANAIRDVPDLIRRRSLHIVFASTSGHTEYVVDTLIDSLKGIVPAWDIEKKMAEKTQPQDLLRGDVLVLTSATWNTGSIEGQLNPHMWLLLGDQQSVADGDLVFSGTPRPRAGHQIPKKSRRITWKRMSHGQSIKDMMSRLTQVIT